MEKTKELIETIGRKHKARLEIERGKLDNWWFTSATNTDGEVIGSTSGRDLDVALAELIDQIEME